MGSHGLALAWTHFDVSGHHRAISKTVFFQALIKQFVFDLGLVLYLLWADPSQSHNLLKVSGQLRKDKQQNRPCFSAAGRRVVKGGKLVVLRVPAQGGELGRLRSAWVSPVAQQMLRWRSADVGRGLVGTLGEGRAFFFSTFAPQSLFNNLSCQKETSSTNKTSGLLLHQIRPQNNKPVDKSWLPWGCDCASLHLCWETDQPVWGSEGGGYALFTVGWKKLFPPFTMGVIDHPLGGWCC